MSFNIPPTGTVALTEGGGMLLSRSVSGLEMRLVLMRMAYLNKRIVIRYIQLSTQMKIQVP